MSSSAPHPSSSSLKKMILLKSSDGESLEIEEAVAQQQSVTMKGLIEVLRGAEAAAAIPVTNVRSDILRRVIDYCNKHADNSSGSHEDPIRGVMKNNNLQSYDADFVKVDHPTLFDLVLAANFLEIPGLLDLCSRAVADMVQGKTPAEVRKFFNINDSFTIEEEEEVLRENQWAFD